MRSPARAERMRRRLSVMRTYGEQKARERHTAALMYHEKHMRFWEQQADAELQELA